jgi:hypothetical protein
VELSSTLLSPASLDSRAARPATPSPLTTTRGATGTCTASQRPHGAHLPSHRGGLDPISASAIIATPSSTCTSHCCNEQRLSQVHTRRRNGEDKKTQSARERTTTTNLRMILGLEMQRSSTCKTARKRRTCISHLRIKRTHEKQGRQRSIEQLGLGRRQHKNFTLARAEAWRG